MTKDKNIAQAFDKLVGVIGNENIGSREGFQAAIKLAAHVSYVIQKDNIDVEEYSKKVGKLLTEAIKALNKLSTESKSPLSLKFEDKE